MTWTSAEISVFELSDSEGDFQTGDHLRYHVERSGPISASLVPQLEKLWNELPEAEQARCHIPHIGFEVRQGGSLELRAALCYECRNISTRTTEGDGWRTFDPSSKQAQALLSLLTSVLPQPV